MSQNKQLEWGCISDRYTIKKIMGKGAFGEVAKATSKATGREVAIKRIPLRQDDFYHTKKVLREISILR